jgi:hypothetical protein
MPNSRREYASQKNEPRGIERRHPMGYSGSMRISLTSEQKLATTLELLEACVVAHQ